MKGKVNGGEGMGGEGRRIVGQRVTIKSRRSSSRDEMSMAYYLLFHLINMLSYYDGNSTLLYCQNFPVSLVVQYGTSHHTTSYCTASQ
jgi:hypothetical protein